jgi:hypothetical protein
MCSYLEGPSVKEMQVFYLSQSSPTVARQGIAEMLKHWLLTTAFLLHCFSCVHTCNVTAYRNAVTEWLCARFVADTVTPVKVYVPSTNCPISSAP